MEEEEEEALILQGQADMWKYMLSFADSMALKSTVELGIPDIIHRHGGPITLSQLAAALSDAPSPDISCLARVMRLLVHRKIFTASEGGEGDTLYGLTHSSRWLLRGSETSLAAMVEMETHPWLVAPWNYLSQCVREGGMAFKKAHGREIWEFASENPEFNKKFNEGMECTARIAMKAIVAGYKNGCINFDLPHVVATAPDYHRVTHVGGDMFHSIPHADAVFMKWILHDWNDEECIKILKNCKKAIGDGKRGKVIIVDSVRKQRGRECGKERTELEWNNLLRQDGFPRYNIINIPALVSIIEAYPL
ncbi:(R,S)-reticuline 7-O-methyltransferase-like [Senna tora]|uniref:(R,S)-reticuline 7-O-methyltransferase-like n=1 Tax=Senna tora TaxID=362788 RepID=A0A834SKJ5_9FABA|nr:(R,S)-reticuline 7-O-methyltransferase-like [Senna tora]